MALKDDVKGGPEFGDRVQLRGCYEIAMHNAFNGELLEYRKVDNVVVTYGRAWVLSQLISPTTNTNYITAIEVGTSTTAPATSDTGMNGTWSTAASNSGRIPIGTFVTNTISTNIPSFQAQCTFATSQANTTLGEAGLFNVTGYNLSTMLSHVTFATINKTTSNTLAISYTISN